MSPSQYSISVATLWIPLLVACGAGDDSASDTASTSSASANDAAGEASSSQTSAATTSATLTTNTSANSSTGGGAATRGGGAGGDTSTDTSSAGALSTDSGTTGGNGGSAGISQEPYANVVAVEVTGDQSNYTFNVSIESADVDCSQFADWWEVLTSDGSLIYRRILQHSHTDENGTSDADAPGNTFTRSGGPVAIAADQEVLVRAHMSNLEGYNGALMRGSVDAGFSRALDVAADFAAEVEDEPPQPTGCDF